MGGHPLSIVIKVCAKEEGKGGGYQHQNKWIRCCDNHKTLHCYILFTVYFPESLQVLFIIINLIGVPVMLQCVVI